MGYIGESKGYVRKYWLCFVGEGYSKTRILVETLVLQDWNYLSIRISSVLSSCRMPRHEG